MRSGLETDGAREESVKQPTTKSVRKLTLKLPTFYLQKEKETFLQTQRDFCDMEPHAQRLMIREKGQREFHSEVIHAQEKLNIR